MGYFDFEYFDDDLKKNKPIIFHYIDSLKSKYINQEDNINKKKDDIKYADYDDRMVMVEDLYFLQRYKMTDPGFWDINSVDDIKNPYFFFCTDLDSLTYISSMNVNIFEGGKCIIPFTSARAAKLRYEDIGDNKFRLEIKDGKLYSVKAIYGENKNNNSSSIYDKEVKSVFEEMKERGEITGGEKKSGVGDISKLLKFEQNRIMMASPKGITFITGVAGSGKTNILLHRIQYLLWEQPGKQDEDDEIFHQDKMLFLCFNKSLQRYIESSIKGKFPEIKVNTIDHWLLSLFRNSFPGAETDIKQDCDFTYEEAMKLICDYFKPFSGNNGGFLSSIFGGNTDDTELDKFKKKLYISEHLNAISGKKPKDYVPEYLVSLNPGLLDDIFGEKIKLYTKKHIYVRLYLLSITNIYDEKNSLDTFKMKIGEYEFGGLKCGNASCVDYVFDKIEYDHIFIDEVQDLTPLQVQIVNGFHNNSITLAGDETQLIKNNLIEKDLPTYFGLRGYGVNKYILGTSYRNSQQTALFANEFIKDIKLKNPIENISFKGLKPIVREVPDVLDEFKYLYHKICDLKSNEPDATICVLYPGNHDVELCHKTLRRMGLFCYAADGKTWDFSQKIHISNYFQAKGLEFDYVFICGLDNFDSWNRGNKETTLYTLVTRGIKRVYMVYSGNELPKILQKIDKSTYEYQYE